MPQNQKGFAPVLIVVILAVVVLGGGLLLYKSGNLPALPGLSGVRMLNIASEKDFPNVTDPILKKHFVAQSNVAAMRSTSFSSGRGTTQITEYDSNGTYFKYRFIDKEILKHEDKEISHLISIDDTTYVKDYSDGKWWKQTTKPQESEDSAPESPDEVKDEFLKEDPTLYKQIGQEACENLTCYKYEQTFGDSPGTRVFWFDTKYFLLRRESSEYGEFSANVRYSYDNINITAPSPTKDVPEGRDIYEYLNQSSGSGSAPAAAPAYDYNSQATPTLPPDIENFSFSEEDMIGY